MQSRITKENFKQKFIENFFAKIPQTTLKKSSCNTPDGYLWLACDKNLIPHQQGERAATAYDAADKSGAMEIQFDGDWGDNFLLPLSQELNSAEKIKASGLIEFYVVGKDFSWCYITTHEKDDCGPFFIEKQKTT